MRWAIGIPIIGAALAWLVSIHVLGMGPENSRPLGWDRVFSWGAPMAVIVYAGVLSRDIRSPIASGRPPRSSRRASRYRRP